MAYQSLPTPSPRSRMALNLPSIVVPTTSLQLPQMSEKGGSTPTIIITPSSPSSELDFHILHVPAPPSKPWGARFRMPWSRSWSKRGPIALESPPLDDAPVASASNESHWLFSRLRLRTAMMLAVPIAVVAAHVVIARSYGISLGLDMGHENSSEWFVSGTGAEMHSEA